MQPRSVPDTRVLVSHSVHQHAYETVLAAQEAGLLGQFVTGVYLTENGLTDPRLRRWLPKGVNREIERQLRRRWHPGVDPSLVTTISRYHLAAAGFRRTLGWFPGLRRLDMDTRAHMRFDRAVARRLRRVDGVGIVHAFEGGCLATLQAARRLDLATVLDVPSAHEFFLEAEAQEKGRPPRLPPLDVCGERELADYLLAPSDHVVECLTRAGVEAGRIVKIPYGVDPSVFRPPAEPRSATPFRVLFVGQIGLRKGVRYLLEAWRRLALRDAELMLVGEPDAAGRKLLREYAGSYRWLGLVPQHEVHRWFQQSSVFVFPSLAEGSARVTYEAMASGLPLVTTSNSGSVMRDGVDGVLVPARDVDALCRTLKLLYEHPEVGTQMGFKARELIEQRYTWRHYRRRLAAVYRAIPDRQQVHTHV